MATDKNAKLDDHPSELIETSWPIPNLVDREDRECFAWIGDLKRRDLDEVLKQPRTGAEPSVRTIYELSGIEVLIRMWVNHMSTALYISEAPLNDLRRRYIRRFYDPNKPETSVKILATKLTCSEQFVRETLDSDPREDPRQVKLFG
jgi:hypothetical protein